MGRVVIFIVAVALCAGPVTRTSSAQGQDDEERKVVSRVAPVFPELAKRKHVGSVVKVVVVIRTNGTVKTARAVGGNPVFMESATDAIRQWKFQAAPQETTEVIQLTFSPR
jgi:TonB family protein